MTAALEGGEWPSARPGRTLPLGKTQHPLYRRLGGPQGRSRPHRDSIPDRPARSQPLYRLSYPAHYTVCVYIYIYIYIYCMCVCMYVCIYIYIYTHTHTHTHCSQCKDAGGAKEIQIETARNAACQRFVSPGLDRPSYVLPGDFQTNTMGHSVPFAQVIL